MIKRKLQARHDGTILCNFGYYRSEQSVRENGVKVNEVKYDLYGPGSGVKWFNFGDPDGNLVQA